MPSPIIREAKPDDASALVELFHRLYAETSFLLFEPGELELKPADLGERIRQTKANASGTMCVAHASGGLVGLVVCCTLGST